MLKCMPTGKYKYTWHVIAHNSIQSSLQNTIQWDNPQPLLSWMIFWHFTSSERFQRGFAVGWNCKRGLSAYFRASYTLLMAAILQSHTLPLYKWWLQHTLNLMTQEWGRRSRWEDLPVFWRLRCFENWIFVLTESPISVFGDHRTTVEEVLKWCTSPVLKLHWCATPCPTPPPRPPSHPSPRPRWRWP